MCCLPIDTRITNSGQWKWKKKESKTQTNSSALTFVLFKMYVSWCTLVCLNWQIYSPFLKVRMSHVAIFLVIIHHIRGFPILASHCFDITTRNPTFNHTRAENRGEKTLVFLLIVAAAGGCHTCLRTARFNAHLNFETLYRCFFCIHYLFIPPPQNLRMILNVVNILPRVIIVH